uniref:Uncharacterized protein n=1 Tax=Arion vulgaris TaxID=1028688 RepID=A0A0B6ZDK0_9EUPU
MSCTDNIPPELTKYLQVNINISKFFFKKKRHPLELSPSDQDRSNIHQTPEGCCQTTSQHIIIKNSFNVRSNTFIFNDSYTENTIILTENIHSFLMIVIQSLKS